MAPLTSKSPMIHPESAAKLVVQVRDWLVPGDCCCKDAAASCETANRTQSSGHFILTSLPRPLCLFFVLCANRDLSWHSAFSACRSQSKNKKWKFFVKIQEKQTKSEKIDIYLIPRRARHLQQLADALFGTLFLAKQSSDLAEFFCFAEKRQNDNKTSYITDDCKESRENHRTELFEFPITPDVSTLSLSTTNLIRVVKSSAISPEIEFNQLFSLTLTPWLLKNLKSNVPTRGPMEFYPLAY